MSQYPEQNRSVDPFASYNSDTVNKLTRMITEGRDLLFSPNVIEVSIDSTSADDTVAVSPGGCFKDDVWIQILSEHRVDFTVATNYVQFDGGFNEAGYYYIVLEYVFQKSRPAPQAAIKIIKPSQRGALYNTNSHLFLKTVEVEFTTVFSIKQLFDYDPDDTSIRRQSTVAYTTVEPFLPTFESEDRAKLIYVTENDAFYFGLKDEWQAVFQDGVRLNVDTFGTNIGDLVAIDSTGVIEADADLEERKADAVVTKVGSGTSGDGKARLLGRADSVNVETGVTVIRGDILYLSANEPGAVTNIKTSPRYQYVGRALTGATGPSTISMLFTPDSPRIEYPFAYRTTTGTELGDLGYVKADGSVGKAIVDNIQKTYATVGIVGIGTESSKTGIVILIGEMSNVKIENGVSVSVGDELFLSGSEAGRVTSVETQGGYTQVVGVALEDGVGNFAGDSTGVIRIIFNPRSSKFSAPATAGVTSGTFAPGDWAVSGSSYIVTIDTSVLSSAKSLTVATYFIDSGPPTTYEQFEPEDITLNEDAEELYISMPSVPSDDVYVTVVGG